MKIPEIGPGEFPQLKKTQRVKPAAETPAVPGPRDSVEVGNEALLVSRLRAKLNESGQPHPKAQELAQQIEEGSYSPDPGELARILFGLEPPY